MWRCSLSLSDVQWPENHVRPIRRWLILLYLIFLRRPVHCDINIDPCDDQRVFEAYEHHSSFRHVDKPFGNFFWQIYLIHGSISSIGTSELLQKYTVRGKWLFQRNFLYLYTQIAVTECDNAYLKTNYVVATFFFVDTMEIFAIYSTNNFLFFNFKTYCII